MDDTMDFNGAQTQDAAFALIPANTLSKVRLTIRPGGAGLEGWLTQSRTSEALYINSEAVILEGPHAKRRVYTRIGYKGRSVNERGDDTYANRGRALIRGILESARGVRSTDQSDRACTARTITGLGELNGLEFVAKIGVERDRSNPDDAGRNVIVAALGPDHAEYARLMGPMSAPTAAPKPVYSPPPAPDMRPANAGSAASNAPYWVR